MMFKNQDSISIRTLLSSHSVLSRFSSEREREIWRWWFLLTEIRDGTVKHLARAIECEFGTRRWSCYVVSNAIKQPLTVADFLLLFRACRSWSRFSVEHLLGCRGCFFSDQHSGSCRGLMKSGCFRHMVEEGWQHVQMPISPSKQKVDFFPGRAVLWSLFSICWFHAFRVLDWTGQLTSGAWDMEKWCS